MQFVVVHVAYFKPDLFLLHGRASIESSLESLASESLEEGSDRGPNIILRIQ